VFLSEKYIIQIFLVGQNSNNLIFSPENLRFYIILIAMLHIYIVSPKLLHAYILLTYLTNSKYYPSSKYNEFIAW